MGHAVGVTSVDGGTSRGPAGDVAAGAFRGEQDAHPHDMDLNGIRGQPHPEVSQPPVEEQGAQVPLL